MPAFTIKAHRSFCSVWNRVTLGSLPLLAGAAISILAPSSAKASTSTTSAFFGPFVSGSQGLEIEAPRDRRGAYGGVGLTVGAYAGRKQMFPTPQLNLRAGGGISEHLTLGVSAMLARYFDSRYDESGGQWTLGLDFEGQYTFSRGFLLHLTLGGMGIPKFFQQPGLEFALGGRAGAGYEFFINSHAAISILVDGDLRVTPKGSARFGPMVTARVSWY